MTLLTSNHIPNNSAPITIFMKGKAANLASFEKRHLNWYLHFCMTSW